MHAAILRSPHAHAIIRAIDVDAARAAQGVAAVLTGADVTALGAPLLAGVKAPIQCWPIAVERVRYVGEPVAVVVAADRYLAEDALELIEVDYEPLPPLSTRRCARARQRRAARGLGSNIASDRSFRYGDPEPHSPRPRIASRSTVDYPRNSCTPIETYGAGRRLRSGRRRLRRPRRPFMGPFSIHAVMARALKVPGNRLRLRTPPDSGGSFGVKQGVFPYIVLMGLAARVAGAPGEMDRGPARASHRLGVGDQPRDQARSRGRCRRPRHGAGAGTRSRMSARTSARPSRRRSTACTATSPAPTTSANVSVRNRVVLTNKTPTGLNRGFGGPQVYYALERLMQRIAVELKLDPLDVIRRNLVPAARFPYRTATGGLLDSGDYPAASTRRWRRAVSPSCARGDAARARRPPLRHRLTAVVEPSVSNMGYITTVLTPEERRKAGPKNGAQATATIALDPAAPCRCTSPRCRRARAIAPWWRRSSPMCSGSSPRTSASSTELDTARDAWSIASGNYASRFAAAVGGAVQLAASG